MIYVCGDTHIPIDIHKLSVKNWPVQKTLTSKDWLIILGDFGGVWDLQESREEQFWMNWLLDKPCQIAFVDGNHENFNRIESIPVTRKHGGKVQKVFTNKKGKSIYRLRRGEVYSIGGQTIFTYGGAQSTDKGNRTEFLSWWRQEIPSHAELDNAYKNLEKHDFKVDFILTHTAPESVTDELLRDFSCLYDVNCSCSNQLELIFKNIKHFKGWHFGHFHIDNGTNPHYIEGNFFCHYNNEPFLLC
jgi:predicted phosphodiesterase